MGPAHAAADRRHGLGSAAAALLFALTGCDRVGAAKPVDAEFPKFTVEKAVIGAAAKFAVGDEFEADAFLQSDRVANGGVLGESQFGLADLAPCETCALAQQLRRTQKAADMLGVNYFSVYRLIQRNKLKVCRALRGKLLVPRTELLKLLGTE